MENKTNIKVLTVKDLWEIFVSRFWIMALSAVLVVAAAFTVITLTFEPQYESVATLYILRQNNENTTSPSNSSEDFSLALKVVNDCNHLIKGHSVLDRVIDELKLDMDYEELYDAVTVTNPSDTRILEVRVESESPELAKQIVDSICVIGTSKIEEAMGFPQVNLYEYGILDNEPCNKTTLFTYGLFGLVTAVIVYAVFLIAFLLDDRIRSDEDIERYLHLSILGDIPNAEETSKKKYGYYNGRKYYRYKYYGSSSEGEKK